MGWRLLREDSTEGTLKHTITTIMSGVWFNGLHSTQVSTITDVTLIRYNPFGSFNMPDKSFAELWIAVQILISIWIRTRTHFFHQLRTQETLTNSFRSKATESLPPSSSNTRPLRFLRSRVPTELALIGLLEVGFVSYVPLNHGWGYILPICKLTGYFSLLHS